jgi:uracil phosphoribosyltransferase
MLVKSKDLPLGEDSLLGIRNFCVSAQSDGRLIVGEGIDYYLRQDYLNKSLPLVGRATGHIGVDPDRWRAILADACAQVAGGVARYGDPQKMSVYYLWRAGLAFLPGFSTIGIKEHYHFGLRRNENSPDMTEEIYLPLNEVLRGDPSSQHVIADVMLATGGSVSTFIKVLSERGIQTNQIILACLIAAPEGIYNLLNEYPNIRIFASKIDYNLDGSGYIVPGLGDAGDKLFSDLSLEFFEPFRLLFNEFEWHLLAQKIKKANFVMA